MSLEQEKFWFNQQFLSHKDKLFESDKSKILELNMSCNTTNYKEFSSPTINFVLHTIAKRYQINLGFQQALDLVSSMEILIKDYNNLEDDFTIYKNYIKRNLKIVVKKTKNGEKCIIFSVIYSDSDYNYIILQQNLILAIYTILNDFCNNYININFQFVNRSLFTENLDQLKALNEALISLPTHLSSISHLPVFQKIDENTKIWNDEELKQNKISDYPLDPTDFLVEDQEIQTPKVEEISPDNMTSELEDFMDNNLDSIIVPEIEKVKNKEINTIKKDITKIHMMEVFEDLSELDKFIISLIPHENQIESWINYLTKKMNLSKKPKDNFLPSISDEDYKSLIYLSKTFFDTNIKKYIEKSGKFKTVVAIKKYKVNDSEKVISLNNELSIDLLTIMCYLRETSIKLTARETDAMRNKSVLYVLFRTISDAMIFSFIQTKNSDMIINLLKERFENFNQNGFFKEFDKIMSNYSLPKIDFIDINNSAIAILKSAEHSALFINDLHDSFYKGNKVSLPYNSKYTLEQILTLISKLDVIKNISEIDFFNEELPKKLLIYNIIYDDIPKDIIELYTVKKKENKSNGKTVDMKSTFERFIENYTHEIPSEDMKTRVIDFFKNNQDEDVDFNSVPFDMKLFGENIIKLFYVWKPLQDTKIKTNLKELFKRVEDVSIDKDQLIMLASKENKIVENELDLGMIDFD
jgi:hypothetical protein